MAYHVFLSENVDATILEVGIGGLLDPTNLVPSPFVTGVTSLGLDHVNVLGSSILQIAGHKSGIFKPGVPALSVQQDDPNVIKVLRARAIEVNSSSFTIVPQHSALADLQLGLAGHHQRTNASLAIAMAQTFLASPRLPSELLPYRTDFIDSTASKEANRVLPKLPSDPSAHVPEIEGDSESLTHLPLETILPSPLPDQFIRALKNTKWPGRCQKVADPMRPERLTWFLDGAHTTESLMCCGKWWKDTLDSRPSTQSAIKVLIFNCTSGRNATPLIRALLDSITSASDQSDEESFAKVVVTRNATYRHGYKSDLKSVIEEDASADQVHRTIRQQILEGFRFKDVTATNSIQEAIEETREMADKTEQNFDVLVTGSLHLIGGFLEVLGVNEDEV